MAKDRKQIDISEVPELLRIVQQVKATGEPCVLTHEEEEMAVLTPVNPVNRTQRPRRKTGIITKDDALWNIVGMAESKGPGDISENKHKYLAEAYADLHE